MDKKEFALQLLHTMVNGKEDTEKLFTENPGIFGEATPYIQEETLELLPVKLMYSAGEEQQKAQHEKFRDKILKLAEF